MSRSSGLDHVRILFLFTALFPQQRLLWSKPWPTRTLTPRKQPSELILPLSLWAEQSEGGHLDTKGWGHVPISIGSINTSFCYATMSDRGMSKWYPKAVHQAQFLCTVTEAVLYWFYTNSQGSQSFVYVALVIPRVKKSLKLTTQIQNVTAAKLWYI